jgi:large subunit ribosomal protein L32
MAVPFRRTGKTSKRKRRTHYKLSAPTLVIDPTSGEYTIPHRVTPNCGYYKGQKVIKTTKEKLDERRSQEKK